MIGTGRSLLRAIISRGKKYKSTRRMAPIIATLYATLVPGAVKIL